jgi:transcriptional regulator NrdR family protein
MIHPNSHPTYNERHEKIIELIDWTVEKYKVNMEKIHQRNEQIIIDNIVEELEKKRDTAINNKKQALLKDEVLEYGEEEDTIDYVLFRICESTGKLY